MKNVKRLLAVLLSVVMILGCMSAGMSVMAANADQTYTVYTDLGGAGGVRYVETNTINSGSGNKYLLVTNGYALGGSVSGGLTPVARAVTVNPDGSVTGNVDDCLWSFTSSGSMTSGFTSKMYCENTNNYLCINIDSGYYTRFENIAAGNMGNYNFDLTFTGNKIQTSKAIEGFWSNNVEKPAGTYTASVFLNNGAFTTSFFDSSTFTVYKQSGSTASVDSINDISLTVNKGESISLLGQDFTVNYSDGTSALVTVPSNLLSSTGYNTDQACTITFNVVNSFDDKNVGQIVVEVIDNSGSGEDPIPGGEDPIPGGEDPIPGGDDPIPGDDTPSLMPDDISTDPLDYPEYPQDGSVKIDKWATGEHLRETGVGEVNLSVTAIPPIYARGVDVVFVTDVSNSMAWAPGTNLPPANGGKNKLQDMQEAVGDFVDIFLSNNIPGNVRGNNTVTFTTFGAWDADLTSTSYNYVDPTRTLFVGNRDADYIKNTVNNIRFTTQGENTFFLRYDGVASTNTADRNYGGTNYDVGMMEASDAISRLKSSYEAQTGEAYDSTAREIHVIFITDGAPTTYNGVQYKTVSTSSPLSTMSYTNPNTNRSSAYTGSAYTQSQWYNFISQNDHQWATKIGNTSHVANMDVIGIDFLYGGFQAGNGNYWIFTPQSGYPLENVLTGLVTGQELDLLLADSQGQLASYLSQIAQDFKDSTEGACTIDTMGSNFSLMSASTVTDSNGNVIALSDYNITANITLSRYPLYHKSDVGTRMNGVNVTNAMVGQKYGNVDVLEEVTFSPDGTKAYSNKKSGNILQDGIINANFFKYNMNSYPVTLSNGTVMQPESFVWYLGTLSEDEIRLSYTAYLDGSMQGERAPGEYETNEEAVLTYTNYRGNKCGVTYPVPELPWEDAKFAYELYLVNPAGEPINENGNLVSFENRTHMSELQEVTQYLNTAVEVDYDVLKDLIPDGYAIYNRDASFEAYFGSGDNGSASVNDSTGTTIVYQPTGTSVDSNGNVTGTNDYTDMKVAFAIVKIEIRPDVVVLDYGKTIEVNPLENDNGNYVINGIKVDGPKAGEATLNSVKLNNGVAQVEHSKNVGADVTVPEGKLLVTPFALNGTVYAFPTLKSSSAENNTGVLRYSVNSNGLVTKYAANSTSGTVLGTIADGEYVKDGANIIYRSGNFASVSTNYNEKVEAITTLQPGTNYYESNGNVSLSTSRSEGLVFNLADGAVISISRSGGIVAGYTFTFTDSYNSNLQATMSGTSLSFTHTMRGYRDADGNEITVTITASRNTTRTSSVNVTCTGYTMKTTDPVEVVSYEGSVSTRTYHDSDMVIYTPFQYMSSIDRVYYFVSFADEPLRNTDSEKLYYSTISFIPATTVYYEDDFGGNAEDGGLYIQYTGDWYTVSDDGTAISGTTANTDTSDRQDRGEIGEGNVPYGYDSSYINCTKFSNGSAARVVGTVSKVNGVKQYDATAEFMFTGTGFDIISRTDLDCGQIYVTVYDENDNFIRNVPVINKGIENLYQIPVISFTGVPYGTYKVKINVCAPSAILNISSSIFYLDAIRIYNPMGLNEADNDEFFEANNAYRSDKEANAFVASIRDYILSIEELGTDESSGAVYVDTIDNEYQSGAVIDQSAINDYKISGPNEEVYLTPGKGIGFALVCSSVPESVQLEIKIPAPLSNSATLCAQTNGTNKMKTITVNSAAEMFYDITEAVQFVTVQKASGTYYRAVVILTNGLEDADVNDIVSITNVKLTYGTSVRNIVETTEGDLIITSGAGSAEITENGEIIETEQPETVYAGLMASWNIYCDVFETVYTQHQSTIPAYDVALKDNFETVAKGQKSTATFTTSQYVNGLVITDENGERVGAEIKSELNEDVLYTTGFESAKTWTVTLTGTLGEHSYTVSALNGEGETATASLTVTSPKAVKLTLVSSPTKVKYNYNEKIDTEGLVLDVTYSDGSVQRVYSGFTLSMYKANHLGNKTVKVSYEGLEASFKINVSFNLGFFIKSLFKF